MSMNKERLSKSIAKRGNFSVYPNEIWDIEILGAAEKVVYIYLLGQSEKWTPGLRQMAEAVGLGKDTVSRALKLLCRYNMLEIQKQGSGLRDLYFLTGVDEWMVSQGETAVLPQGHLHEEVSQGETQVSHGKPTGVSGRDTSKKIQEERQEEEASLSFKEGTVTEGKVNEPTHKVNEPTTSMCTDNTSHLYQYNKCEQAPTTHTPARAPTLSSDDRNIPPSSSMAQPLPTLSLDDVVMSWFISVPDKKHTIKERSSHLYSLYELMKAHGHRELSRSLKAKVKSKFIRPSKPPQMKQDQYDNWSAQIDLDMERQHAEVFLAKVELFKPRILVNIDGVTHDLTDEDEEYIRVMLWMEKEVKAQEQAKSGKNLA